jgi:hypothetical protein
LLDVGERLPIYGYSEIGTGPHKTWKKFLTRNLTPLTRGLAVAQPVT